MGMSGAQLVPYSRIFSSVPLVGVRLQRKRASHLTKDMSARKVRRSRSCRHFGFGHDEECLLGGRYLQVTLQPNYHNLTTKSSRAGSDICSPPSDTTP